MIASLPMYDWPEVRDATDRWWDGLARHLGSTVALSRDDDYVAAWTHDDLLFSQTCGYPFTHSLSGKVQLVGTPHYGVDGCEGPQYQSIVLARAKAAPETFRGATAAVNTPDSMSGMLALQLVFAPFARDGSFFGKSVETGGHLTSMKAVQAGKADVCAIDAVCVAMAKAYRPDLVEGLAEVARSPLVPTLPYITRSGDVARLREALHNAFGDPDLQAVREQLFLSGFSVLESQDYDVIVELEAAMEQGGGLKLL